MAVIEQIFLHSKVYVQICIFLESKLYVQICTQ